MNPLPNPPPPRTSRRRLFQWQWKSFWLCLPTVLAVGFLVFIWLAVSSVRHKTVELDQYYRRLVGVSLATKHFEAARIACLRCLTTARTDRDRADWMLYLAMALKGLGAQADADALLAAAAPLDHPGSPQAHLIVAQSLLSATNLNSPTLRLAEKHLLAAIALDPNSAPAGEMLGRFYLNTRRYEDAQEYLQKVYPAKPDVALLLAISFDMQKNRTGATLWADRAIVAFRKILIARAPQDSPEDRRHLVHAVSIKAKYDFSLLEPLERAMLYGTNALPQNNPAVWIDWVRGLMIEKKYASARDILDLAARISPSPAYATAMAEVCANLAEKLSADQAADQWPIIKQGLKNNPQHVRLRWLLIQATHSPGASGADAKKTLTAEMAAATGSNAAWWHFLLATDCRVHGNPEAAHQHLLDAYKLDPTIPEIQNDLAWDYWSGKPQNLPRALELVEAALKKQPENPNFHDTRGRILAGLGRKPEAIADLKFALAKLSGNDAKDTLALLTQLGAFPAKKKSNNDGVTPLKSPEKGAVSNSPPKR